MLPLRRALHDTAGRDDQRDSPAYQLLRQDRQLVIMTISPPAFDGEVLSLEIAFFVQALA